jgi:hypothetical protein
MTFSRLRHGIKTSGLTLNEIEEGTEPSSLDRGGREGKRTLSSGEECSESKSRVLDLEDICWRGIRCLDRSEEQWQEKLKSEAQSHPTGYRPLNF